MTEEIKEIFYKLKSDDYYEEHYQQSVYYERDLKKLENHITNLQKENLALARENEQEKQFIKDCGFENTQQLALEYISLREEKENFRKLKERYQLEKENYKQRNEKAIDELFELKNMIYKPETREENFEIQRKISSIIKKLGLGGDE